MLLCSCGGAKNSHGDQGWSIEGENCDVVYRDLTIGDKQIPIDGCIVQYTPSVGQFPEILNIAYYASGDVVTSVAFRSDQCDGTTHSYSVSPGSSTDYVNAATLGGLGSGASGTVSVQCTIGNGPTDPVSVDYQPNVAYPADSKLVFTGPIGGGMPLAGQSLSGDLSSSAQTPVSSGGGGGGGGGGGSGGDQCSTASSGPCKGLVSQCGQCGSGTGCQAPCYCAAACICHYCNDSCEAANRANASRLGTTCSY